MTVWCDLTQDDAHQRPLLQIKGLGGLSCNPVDQFCFGNVANCVWHRMVDNRQPRRCGDLLHGPPINQWEGGAQHLVTCGHGVKGSLQGGMINCAIEP